ncbi:MAG: HDIG domain-containing protein [Deltaproteobacteria bacterium]|nr:HDIG domain-containing protein [Deltaproteobacteria bacterium]MBW1920894.1 HDIG domain-containing protein [Deltaproteobacteria bacterium]MBW1934101.1 HDIG domain-containing protein [Deltaproteobacteria bacterium]MBW1976846.1 HDIG domain-containing protein [Deltaproteobacteria bacterium]MBW2043872.1 HDIG domain-containing protein [Deltaproteobacteria bacterium]
MIPSREKCLELIARYKMPPHIMAHSIMVEKVAILIALSLVKAGQKLSLEKVRAGALLHDIAKDICLKSGCDHAAEGERICRKHDVDEIAEIVGEHIRLKNYAGGEQIDEKEIVYYADKRVNHQTVVSLEERLKYLLSRYAKDEDKLGQAIKENFDLCKKVEKKLFAKLDYTPDQVAGMIK